MDHMFGCRSVVAVASQPSGQVAHAGNPLLDTAPGIGAPVASIVRPVLNGLYAAVLLVDPPSATCHASRSATSAGVAGALTPWRTQSSQPGGSGVPPTLCAGVAQPAVAVSMDPPSPATAMASARPTLRRMRVMGGRRWSVACRRWVVRFGTPRGGESIRGMQDWHVPSRVLLRVYRRHPGALESVVRNLGIEALGGPWRMHVRPGHGALQDLRWMVLHRGCGHTRGAGHVKMMCRRCQGPNSTPSAPA